MKSRQSSPQGLFRSCSVLDKRCEGLVRRWSRPTWSRSPPRAVSAPARERRAPPRSHRGASTFPTGRRSHPSVRRPRTGPPSASTSGRPNTDSPTTTRWINEYTEVTLDCRVDSVTEQPWGCEAVVTCTGHSSTSVPENATARPGPHYDRFTQSFRYRVSSSATHRTRVESHETGS